MWLFVLAVIAVLFFKHHKKKKTVPARKQITSTHTQKKTSPTHEQKKVEVSVTFTPPHSSHNYNYPWDKNRPSDNSDYTKANFLNRYSSKLQSISDDPDDFPRSFSYALHIYDPIKMQNNMLHDGYLRRATPEEVINSFTVERLKGLLEQYGYPKTGKKADLISRIIDYIDLTKIELPPMCCISEKGQTFIDQHSDLIKLAGNPYGITYDEYIATKKSRPDYLSYNDIIWNVFARRERFSADNYDARCLNARHRAAFLRAENRLPGALEFYLHTLYYEMNDPARVIPDDIKQYLSKEEMKPRQIDSRLLESIFQLKEHFVDSMISSCTIQTNVPKKIIKKSDFERLVNDIFTGQQIDVSNYLPDGFR